MGAVSVPGAGAPATVALDGVHAVKHALRFAPGLVIEVVARDDRALALLHDLAPDLDPVVSRGAVEHPTGVRGVGLLPEPDRSVLGSRAAPLVLLDDPKHPGNAGAVVRVAAAAGASGVAVCGDLDPWGVSCVRGAAGLQYALPVLRCSPDEVTGPVVVLSDEGRVLEPGDLGGAVLVAGSERSGVSTEWRERADRVVALPMREGVSSLNLATAVAAALYCWRLGPGSAG